SSLDWGQDLPSLKRWLDANRHDGEPAYLSYFGTSRPSHFGIDAVALPGFIDRRSPERFQRLRPGLYIFGATMLTGVYTQLQGRWGETEEALYQQLLSEAPAVLGRNDVPSTQVSEMLNVLDQLRFGRLIA